MTDTVKPLTPAEVNAQKKFFIHPQMIQAVNELLIKYYNSGKAVIRQNEIVKLFLDLVGEGWTSDRIFKEHQMDIEAVFREQGWNVKYDKPGYSESGEAFFEFTPK